MTVKAEQIDFSGVQKEIGRGGSVKIPPGMYKVKIAGVEKKWKDNDKTNAAYYNWKFQITEGKHKGVPLYYITSLKPEALWNLRNLIHAVSSKNVAGRSVKFNPETLIGRSLAVDVADDEFTRDGVSKIVSRAVDVQPLSVLEEGDEEEESEEEEEESEEEEEDLEDVDLDEI
jgi:hypothetical protein